MIQLFDQCIDEVGVAHLAKLALSDGGLLLLDVFGLDLPLGVRDDLPLRPLNSQLKHCDHLLRLLLHVVYEGDLQDVVHQQLRQQLVLSGHY